MGVFSEHGVACMRSFDAGAIGMGHLDGQRDNRTDIVRT